MNRRNFLFLGAATAMAGMAAGVPAAEAALPRAITPATPEGSSTPRTLDLPAEEIEFDTLLQEAQWGPPPHRGGPPPWAGPPHRGGPPPRRRRQRCWVENVRVRYTDRFGRPFWRTEQRRVCR